MSRKRNGCLTQNAAAVALRWHGIELKGAEFDVLLAAYIINPGHTYDDVASVAKEHQLNVVSTDEAVYGKGAKQAVPGEDELADHLGRKAEAITMLRETPLDELKKRAALSCLKSSKCRLPRSLAKWNPPASRSMSTG